MLKYDDQSIVNSSKKRILVVEDDIQMSKFIQFKLDYLGYEVVGDAVNCEQALQRSQMLKPDLVLMDIMLKGSEDGIETAQKIIDLQHVPIIYLTAHEDEILFDRAKITEPFGYLIKPFNDRDLRIVIETSLYRHAQDKRIKKALQDVRNIINSTIFIMITYDLEGHIIEFNKKAEDIFGLKRKLAKKRLITTLLNDQADGTVLLDGDPLAICQHEEVSFKDETGNAFLCLVILSPLQGSDDSIQGRLLVAQPI
ncbi:MAG: response regulator [Candidatus Marinimicrobia bacterium]|nr:response regulator [Candidatus Neomarinimicrobiota bacterium]